MAAEAFDPESRPERARAVRAVRNIAAALIMLVAVAAAAWLAIGGDVKRSQPQTIAAESTPERAPPDPDKPNGAVVAHQDQIVYEIVGRDRAKPAEEAIAPAPEPPMPAPEPPPGTAVDLRPDPPPRPDSPVQLLPPAPAPDRIGMAPPPQASRPETASQTEPRASAGAPLPDARRVADPDAASEAPAAAVDPATQRPDLAPAPSEPDPPAAATEPAPPAAAEPAPVLAARPPPGRYRIQLGAVRDKAAAQREWRRLRQKHTDILGGLQMFIQEVDIAGKGVFHRIQAGPLPERELAEIACDQLKSRKAPCFVIAR